MSQSGQLNLKNVNDRNKMPSKGFSLVAFHLDRKSTLIKCVLKRFFSKKLFCFLTPSATLHPLQLVTITGNSIYYIASTVEVITSILSLHLLCCLTKSTQIITVIDCVFISQISNVMATSSLMFCCPLEILVCGLYRFIQGGKKNSDK